MFKQFAVSLAMMSLTLVGQLACADEPGSSTVLKGGVQQEIAAPPENCTCINSKAVHAVEVNGQWQLQDGDRPLLQLRTKAAAEAAVNMISTYAATDICSLGSSTDKLSPTSIYFKTAKGAPEASLANEDAIPFNNETVSAQQRNGSWKLVTPDDVWLLDFGSNEAAARNAADIMHYYGFTHQCFVGSPARELMYWHK